MLRRFLLVSIVTLFLGGCGGIKAQHNFDPWVDFSTLKTYSWQQVDETEQLEELTRRNLMQAIEVELQAKGFSPDSANPDMLLSLSWSKKKVYSGSVGLGASVGVPVGSHGSLSIGGGRSAPRENIEGTVALDMVSAASGKLVWQGTATSTRRSSGLSPEQRNQLVREIVAKLLEEFPPGK